MKAKEIMLLLPCILFFTGCSSTKKIIYFQDIASDMSIPMTTSRDITLEPGDQVSIVVNSKDPDLAVLFNLPIVSNRVGSSSSLSYSQQISVYTVDSTGSIDFPILGRLMIADMTRSQLSDFIKHQLIAKQLLRDPTVTVDFVNLYFTVLGEVKNPGRYKIDRDQVSLLDALGRAGDLTIYGIRKNVLVIREKQQKYKTYRLNLLNSNQLYASGGFYIRQNDVIYVQPNSVRQRQSTVNGNNVRSSSFWLSLASLMTTVVVLFMKH